MDRDKALNRSWSLQFSGMIFDDLFKKNIYLFFFKKVACFKCYSTWWIVSLLFFISLLDVNSTFGLGCYFTWKLFSGTQTCVLSHWWRVQVVWQAFKMISNRKPHLEKKHSRRPEFSDFLLCLNCRKRKDFIFKLKRTHLESNCW